MSTPRNPCNAHQIQSVHKSKMKMNACAILKSVKFLQFCGKNNINNLVKFVVNFILSIE